MFDLENLKELKVSLNELIKNRIIYIHSDIPNKEKKYTEERIKYDNKLLEKVLILIKESENK